MSLPGLRNFEFQCTLSFNEHLEELNSQKVITPLFVKIELLVPMCSVTTLVSWNQTIFSKKKKKKKKKTFLSYY